MSAVVDGLNQLSVSWWNYLVHASWQAALVGAVLLSLVHLLGGRWPAPLRYAILILALLKFACPPLLPVPTGIFTRFRISETPFPAKLVIERKPAQASYARPQAVERSVTSRRQSFVQPIWHQVRAVQWTTWLMLVHALGTVTIVAVLARQANRLRALARAARRLRLRRMSQEYRDLAIAFGVYRIPAVVMSKAIEGPIAFGVKRPAILLPVKIVRRLSRAELKTVLAHELAHCQRGDLWVTWVQALLLALWWFHPVFWLVNRSLYSTREDCCDDLLLARGVVGNDAYCDLLLRAASESSSHVGWEPAVALTSRLHPLARRFARISDWTLPRAERISSAGAIAVLCAAALLWPGARTAGPKPSLAGESQAIAQARSDQAQPTLAPRLASQKLLARDESRTSDSPQQGGGIPSHADYVRVGQKGGVTTFHAGVVADTVFPPLSGRRSPGVPPPVPTLDPLAGWPRRSVVVLPRTLPSSPAVFFGNGRLGALRTWVWRGSLNARWFSQRYWPVTAPDRGGSAMLRSSSDGGRI